MIRSIATFLLPLVPLLAGAQNHPWPDPVANHVVPYQSLGITHGPVLGQINTDSVRVWIRTAEPMDFTVAVSESLPFDGAAETKGKTAGSKDNTGWVTVKGLKPNTRYFYAVKLKGHKKWTTQCYIKGEKQNETDGVLRRMQDKKKRDSLIVDFAPIKGSKANELSARFDIIMGFTPQD